MYTMKIFYKKMLKTVPLFCLLILSALTLPAQQFDLLGNGAWLSKISKEHPRIFINKKTLIDIKAKVKQDLCSEYEKLKKEVDELPFDAPIVMNTDLYIQNADGSIKTHKVAEQGQKLFKYNGGDQAVKIALVYLISEDPKLAAKAVNYIKLANYVFQWTASKNIWVDLTGNVRINALTAYDWVCSTLSTAQRKDLLMPMLNYIEKSQPEGEYTFRRTIGGAIDGNYGETALQWFAGLAGYGDGVDDVRSEKMLKAGGELFVDMMNHRERISAGSGLLSSSTVSYSFFNYPYSSFNFFHTWNSAFGEDLTDKWKQMLDFPNWFDWAAIKLSSTGRMLFHGIGDIGHSDNQLRMDDLYTHMAQVAHFYGAKYPDKIGKAYSLQANLPADKRKVLDNLFPFLPFILTDFNSNKVRKMDALDYGRYFYNSSFGLLLMRSGKGDKDTYASFRFGADQINHQHYDDLSFVIYKENFLALDAGSRTETDHHHNFAPQSVAHNTILIHEPHEPMPDFWKAWSYVPDGKTYYNHGGQNYKDKSLPLALQSTEDFIYAAADATKNYAALKSREVVRQFVFLKPNVFVIYDRVASVKQSQKKEFLLHFQEKPVVISTNQWKASHGGNLWVTTLLPEVPNYNLVGGPGREFEASGRNWELAGGADWDKTMKLTGKWRLEISDAKEADRSVFLHVLQASAANDSQQISQSVRKSGDLDIVSISDEQGNKWELSFNRTASVGLHLKMTDKLGKLKYNKTLENVIEKNN
ncbi:heparinase II/III domain-containing protein [Pseudopedobacter beijingensis]|uniref:Heparinase II/III family protein n=1 Tax=Pseudopedobacter beijingensis TaxID=1207056 RepID=A0ABW4I7M4_9SPHI